MRLTPALRVRNLLAKLHPPLPTSPRESQQLLKLLEGSLQKHLDETHPSPAQGQPYRVARSNIPLTPLESPSNATHHYLDAILNHPTFAKQSEQEKPNTSVSANASHVFTQAMLAGNVTLPLLRRCLTDYVQGLRRGDRVDERERLAAKLESWLYTASPASKEAFLSSVDILNIAVSVTQWDRQEALAWDWLRMVYERKFGLGADVHSSALSDLKWLSIEDHLVSFIMRMSSSRGDLNDAAKQFVEACQYRLNSGRAATRPTDANTKLRYVPLDRSWKRLAAGITFYRGKHGISAPLFDRAIQHCTSWSYAPNFSSPFVVIHHPISPSAEPLYQHLSDPELAGQLLSTQMRGNKKARKIVLSNILDGAQLSLDRGFRDQAQFLINFAKTHYSELLPALTNESAPELRTQIRTAQVQLESQSYSFAMT